MMHWEIFRIKIEAIYHLMREYMKIKETINNYLGNYFKYSINNIKI